MADTSLSWQLVWASQLDRVVESRDTKDRFKRLLSDHFWDGGDPLNEVVCTYLTVTIWRNIKCI